MQRLIASLFALLASILLSVLLLAQSVLGALKSPDFLMRVANAGDLYQLAIGQLESQVQGIAARSGFPVPGQQLKALVRQLLPQAVFEAELARALGPLLAWFNSKEPSSKLEVRISLAELKKNLGPQGTGIPDQIALLELIPQTARGQVLTQLEEVRGYYHLARMLTALLWGFLGLLIIFIILLRVVSLRSMLRFVGSVLMLGGGGGFALIIGAPKALSLIVSAQQLQLPPAVVESVLIMFSQLFEKTRLVAVALAVGGVVAVIVAQAVGRKRTPQAS